MAKPTIPLNSLVSTRSLDTLDQAFAALAFLRSCACGTHACGTHPASPADGRLHRAADARIEFGRSLLLAVIQDAIAYESARIAARRALRIAS